MADFRVVLLTFAALIFCFFGCWFIDKTITAKKILARMGYFSCVLFLMLICVLIGMKAIHQYKCNINECVSVNIIGGIYGR